MRLPVLSAALAAALALTLAPAAAALPDRADQPKPSNEVQSGPAPSSSKVFHAVAKAWHDMTSTEYSHKYSENPKTGVYQFDCVGSVDYFLKLGAPKALADLRTGLNIRKDYVAAPPAMLQYLVKSPSRNWKVISDFAAVRPGDIVVMDSITSPDDGTPGHAMIAAGGPLLLSNGTYALTVYDSTGTPHGADDSRRWDPRTQPSAGSGSSGAPTSQQDAGGSTPSAGSPTAAPPVKATPSHSGLGFGTIQLWSAAVSKLDPPSPQMSWTVGTKPIKTGIVIARALR